MQDIQANNRCKNMTGYCALSITPLNEVSAMNFTYDGKKEIVFSQDGSLGKIDVFDIKVQSNQDSDFYKNKITANFRSADDMNSLFDRLSKNRFVVKVTDNNGYSFIYGSKEEPLRFSFDFIGNATPKQAKEYQLTFAGETTFGAFLISG